MGNIPESDRSDEFRKWVVEIDQSWSDEQTIEEIDFWLDSEKERLNRARLGQDLVLQKYTYNVIVDQMYKAWIDFLFNDIRGMHYPHPFTHGHFVRGEQTNKLTLYRRQSPYLFHGSCDRKENLIFFRSQHPLN